MPKSTGMDDRVECRTPTAGKKPTRIVRAKFDAVRRAILAVVPARGEGVQFSQLPHRVQDELSPEMRSTLGSIMWYTTTVKLEMEVRGELVRVDGASPQRLLRGKPAKAR